MNKKNLTILIVLISITALMLAGCSTDKNVGGEAVKDSRTEETETREASTSCDADRECEMNNALIDGHLISNSIKVGQSPNNNDLPAFYINTIGMFDKVQVNTETEFNDKVTIDNSLASNSIKVGNSPNNDLPAFYVNTMSGGETGIQLNAPTTVNEEIYIGEANSNSFTHLHRGVITLVNGPNSNSRPVIAFQEDANVQEGFAIGLNQNNNRLSIDTYNDEGITHVIEIQDDGDIEIQGNLEVEANAGFFGEVYFNDALNIDANVTIEGDLILENIEANKGDFESTLTVGQFVTIENPDEDAWLRADNLKINTLSGTGNAYACLDADGNLYRSETACN